MKKQLFLSVIATLLALHLNAQSNVEDVKGNDSVLKWHRNVISTDPLFLALGAPNLSYEIAVSKKISLYTNILFDRSYWYEWYHTLSNTTQVRWYPNSDAPRGFYIAAFSYYQRAWFVNHIQSAGGMCGLYPSEPIDTIIQGNLNSLAIGVIAGYTFIIRKRIAAEFYGGGGINFW